MFYLRVVFLKSLFGKTNFPLIILLLLSLVMTACGDNPTPAPVSSTTAAAAQANATSAAPVTVNIDMIGFKFSPTEVSIPAGSTVIWTNKESVKHDVVANDNSFESPTLDKGQTFSRKFDTPGIINYYCKFHGSPGQGMIGKLTVTPAQAGAVASTTTTQAATTVAIATTTSTATTVAATTVTPTTVAASTAVATTAAPTAAAATTAAATQAVAQATPAGTINFRDDLQLTDQLVINFTVLPPPPSGKVFFGWVQNSSDGKTSRVGQVIPGTDGVVSFRFSDPNKGNLLANYDKFLVTQETLDPTPSAPSSAVAYSGQLPGPSLIHIRHLLVSFPATPNKIGLEVGLREQTTILRRHTEFMLDALKANDLATVKLHAEHLVNLIEGSKGPDYGDLNKDGQVTNPGDGYGLFKNGDQLGYLDGSKEHANLAARAVGATADIKLHASHVGITVDNASGWVSTIRDRSLAVLKVNNIASATPMVQEISTLANQTLNGVDLKGDGQILPVPGSGGVITSYQHSQLMAAIPLYVPGQEPTAATGTITNATQPAAVATTAAANATATTTAATIGAAAGAGAIGGPGQEVKIDISGFKFSKNPLTIKVGTKVTWTNQDSAPHTATADNSSWDSGTLQKGQSFSFTFNKAGLVSYHCEIHPNMTSIITVVD